MNEVICLNVPNLGVSIDVMEQVIFVLIVKMYVKAMI